MKERINYAFLIAHVSHDEVLNIINSLEYKATGPVSIPIKLLKLIPDLILVPLCNIINVSFNTGVFPNLLKLVKVMLINIFNHEIQLSKKLDLMCLRDLWAKRKTPLKVMSVQVEALFMLKHFSC